MSALSIIGIISVFYALCSEKLNFLKGTPTRCIIFFVFLAFTVQSFLYTNILLSPFGLLVLITPLLYGFSVLIKEQDDRHDIFYILIMMILVRNIESTTFFLFLIIAKGIFVAFQTEGRKEERLNYIKNSLSQLFIMLVAFLAYLYLNSRNTIYLIPLLLSLYFHMKSIGLRVSHKMFDDRPANIAKSIISTLMIPYLILYKISAVENGLNFLVLDGAKYTVFSFFISFSLYITIRYRSNRVIYPILSSLLLGYLYLSSAISFELMVALDLLSYFCIFIARGISNPKVRNIFKSLLLLTPMSPFFYLVFKKIGDADLGRLELFGIMTLLVLFYLNVISIKENLWKKNSKILQAKLLACFLSILVVVYIYDTI